MRTRLVDISHLSFRRLVLLVLFVLSNTSVLPLTLLVCARIDGGHAVELSCSRQSVGIRLTHVQRASNHHRHSNWLSWFAANTDSSHHADHQLTIASGDGWPSQSDSRTFSDACSCPEVVTSLSGISYSVLRKQLLPSFSRALPVKPSPRGVRMQV